MALKTVTAKIEAQGIMRIYNFADIDDTDTFTGPSGPKSFIVVNKTDNVAVSATESSGTYTFTVASAGTNKEVDLIVIV